MPSQTAETSNGLHPISSYQSHMLKLALETEPSSFANQEKTICLAFRILPGVPPRRLRRAFDKLVERHDSLRLRFVEVGGRWCAEILRIHPQGLLIEDLSHLTRIEQDAVVLERAKKPMTALSKSLFEMQLLKFGKEGDVILLRLNHAIGDGYSMAVLTEDLLKFLLMRPPQNKAAGHADFMRHREQGLRHRVREKEQFWQSRLLPLPNDLSIGRTLKGLSPQSYRTVGTTCRLDDIFPAALLEKLSQLAQKTGVSIYCYLHAAFSETICKMGGAKQVLVKSPVSRHHTELADFIGADLQSFMVKYDCDPDNLAERASWVAQQISEGAAHLPTSAFDAGSKIDQCLEDAQISASRFLVHIEVPSGRLNASPFKNLFYDVLNRKASIGFVSLERIPLPRDVETNFELTLLLDQARSTPAVALIANDEAFNQDDLAFIAQDICRRIEQCCDAHLRGCSPRQPSRQLHS